MYSLIFTAIGFSKTSSPAISMLCEYIFRQEKGQISEIHTNAKDMTVSHPTIAKKDFDLLYNKKFIKLLPKDFVVMQEAEFVQAMCDVEIKDRKTKQFMHLEPQTARIFYRYLEREILQRAKEDPELYPRFMQKATKKNIEGWQELSQTIGNFTGFVNERLNAIGIEIEDLLKEKSDVGERGEQGLMQEPTLSPVPMNLAGTDESPHTEFMPPGASDPRIMQPDKDRAPSGISQLPENPEGEMANTITPSIPDTEEHILSTQTPQSIHQGVEPPISAPASAPLDFDSAKQAYVEMLRNPDVGALQQFLSHLTSEGFQGVNTTALEIMEEYGIPSDFKQDDIMILKPQQETVIRNIEIIQEIAERTFGEDIGNPEIYFRLGHVAMLTGKTQKAREMYTKSLALNTRIGNEIGVLRSLNKLGLVLTLLGEYESAVDYFRNACQMSEQMNNEDIKARCFEYIGTIHRLKGEFDLAMQQYEQAKKMAEGFDDRKRVADIMSLMGLVYDLRGDKAKALETYQRVVHIYQVLEEKKETSMNMVAMGGIHAGEGEFDKAQDYYCEALQISREIDYKQGMGVILNNIGLVNKAKGDLDEAKENFRMALEISEEIGDRRNMSTCLNNISTIYKEQKDYEKAIHEAKKALKIAEGLDDKRNMSLYLNNISIMYKIQGRDRKALGYLERALQISENLGDKNGIAGRLNNIASIYYKRGEYEKAMEYLQRALPIFEELGSPVAETVRENINTLKNEMGSE